MLGAPDQHLNVGLNIPCYWGKTLLSILNAPWFIHFGWWEQALFLATCEWQALFGLIISDDVCPTLHGFLTDMYPSVLCWIWKTWSTSLQFPLSLQFLPLQWSALHTLTAWFFPDSQFLTLGRFLSLPQLPLPSLKPRNPVKVDIWDNHGAYLICFPSLRNCYPYFPDIRFLEKCYYLYISGMILSLVWFQAGDYIILAGTGCPSSPVSYWYHSLILWTILVSCQDISFLLSWFNLGFSSLCLKNTTNNRQ